MLRSDGTSSIQEENTVQMLKRIENWKSRLIDLSKRNNLLYFKQSKRGNLVITSPDAKTVLTRLVVKQSHLEFWMPPEEIDISDPQKFSVKKIHPVKTEPPTSNQLVCEGLNRKDLEGILKSLHRRSLSDYRERGVRILHAAFGMLIWKDILTSEEVRSPLIMVPIELSKENIRKPFEISVPQVEEEAVLNPALQVKLKNDYKIDLPPLPEEWDGNALTDYYNEVRKAVASQGWIVEPTLVIGLFSFHKLVIYNDLDANTSLIIRHPMVRAIAGVKDTRLVQENLPEENDVDRIENPENTFRVLDADSSQRVAIDYALQGQSFVMQGPPGTGKSQTIANIVAECIAQGKSVLFVSDKMAALEVVYKRLSDVGLAHFCLELHSSKANKQEVVAELKRCLDEQLINGKLPSMHDFEKLKQLRYQLNEYVTALHAKQPLLHKSAYDVLGELASLQKVPFVQVGLVNPGSLTPQRMHELEEMMTHLKTVWQVVEEDDFPWHGYRGNRYNLEIRSELTNQLEQVISTINSLIMESTNYAQQLGLESPPNLDRINWLIGLSNLLMESPRPEAHWVTNRKIDQLISEANTYYSIIQECQANRNKLLERYNDSFFTLMLNASAELEHALSTMDTIIVASSIKDGELLRKREALLNLARNTPMTSQKWAIKCILLTEMFGLPNETLTPERVTQLARIAALCFAEEKPEQNWFNFNIFQQTQELAKKAKDAYQEYNALRAQLKQNYTDRLFDLDLEELAKRYNGYQGTLKIFSSSYRNDQKEIALVTHEGKVPKTILKDLFDARKAKALKIETEAFEQQAQECFGRYYAGYETDFEKLDKAIENTKEIYKLTAGANIPEKLAKLLSSTSFPPQEIRQAANELNESMTKWNLLVSELSNIIPVHLPNSNLTIQQTSLANLEEWANETVRQLSPLYDLTREILYSLTGEEPNNYAQLIQDLKLSESIRRKEAEFLNEKETLQNRFGFRFLDLHTNWPEIISVLQWSKKVQGYFGEVAIPDAFAQLAYHGPTAAPARMEMMRLYEATPRVMSNLELRFEAGALYNGQRLQDMQLETIHNKVKALRDRVDDLQIFIDFKETKSRFTLANLEEFFNRLVEQRPTSAELIGVLRRGVYQEWINNLYSMDLRLGRFRRENHEQLIAEFRYLDQELIHLASNRVIEAANSRKPQDVLIQATDSEVNTLLKEASKKRRLMPIRNLLQKIPHILPRIKPCMLMSPISVSQFLDSEAMKFDVVLFDEASQIVPEDAICSIFRGRTIVVAGDNKQLPPTSFFQKSLLDDVDWDEATDDEIEVFDSILDECLGIGLPVKTLRWHYRSRHENLIAFSNNYFYDGTLVTFPSAEANHNSLGVKLAYVPTGIYDRGGKRNNIKEAEVVADLVFEHFKQYPKKTLGVVTFSIAQMETVEDAIDRRLNENPEFEQFFREDRLEGFFVKNLENVQGDERDVIMFSVGYGKDATGQMAMNFGPLNKPGGERRLNVAVTRAREKTIMVTSIRASDIDLNATKAAGVAILHHYLDYAEKGPDSLELKESKAGYVSLLEEDVAEEIRAMDYKVDTQVGCSDYRIDIGVIDPANPGRYLIGVECDGPTYRSSTSARDRDRLREQVLNRLGWKIHRIWAPAWVARRESEARKLKEALQQACQQPEKIAEKVPKEEPRKDENVRKETVVKVQFGGLEKIGVPYKVHTLKATYEKHIKVPITKYPYTQIQKNEFHFPTNRSQQTRLLAELVKAEGPIHFDYAVDRLADAWGLRRTSPKIAQAVKEAMEPLIREHKITVRNGEFLWPVDIIDVPVRVPVANAPESKRRPEHIPPEEIENAMKQIAQYSLGIGSESLITETAKVFGFTHSREKIKEIMTSTYQKLIRERKLIVTNDIVTAP
jgi:very-short-patch-repair endonuclease